MSMDIIARDSADEAVALSLTTRNEARRNNRSALLCCATRGRVPINAGIAASLASGEIDSVFDLNAVLGDGSVWKRPASGSRSVADGDISSGSRTLTSATAAFTSGDVGKSVRISGTGVARAMLCGSIVTITNSTTAVCNFVNTSTNSSSTVSYSNIFIVGIYPYDGTDPNMAACTLACDAFHSTVVQLILT